MNPKTCDCHDVLTHSCVPWLIRTCAMTHSYVGHDSVVCVTWPVDMLARYAVRSTQYAVRSTQYAVRSTQYAVRSSCEGMHLQRWFQRFTFANASFVSVIWRFDVCAMTRSQRFTFANASFVSVIWRFDVCAMTRSQRFTFANASHVTDKNEVCHDSCVSVTCHEYEWVMSHICECLVRVCKITRWYARAMTHAYVWHDSLICGLWFPDSHESRIRIYDMTRGHACHDSYMSVTCLGDTCAMTHSYVWHDSLMCVPWLNQRFTFANACLVTDKNKVGHDSCVSATCHEYEWVMSHICECLSCHR